MAIFTNWGRNRDESFGQSKRKYWNILLCSQELFCFWDRFLTCNQESTDCPVPSYDWLIQNKTFESTASKIEITLTDDKEFEKSETGKTEGNKRPQLKMQLEQYNQKSFMYYQQLSESTLNESLSVNITDRIKKLDINKTTPISLKVMVLRSCRM